MFYFLSNIKFKLISIIIFTLVFYSCTTVKTSYVEEEKIPEFKKSESVFKIKGAFLKSGEFVELQNKNAKLIMTENAIPKGIIYNENIKKNFIPIDNVSVLKIEVESNNYWVPVGIIAGLTVAVIVFLIIVFSYGHFNLGG